MLAEEVEETVAPGIVGAEVVETDAINVVLAVGVVIALIVVLPLLLFMLSLLICCDGLMLVLFRSWLL